MSEQTPRPRPADRRNAGPRHPSAVPASWHLLGATADAARPSAVRDISAAGIALVVDTPLPRGTLLVVALKAPGQRFADPLLVRVRRLAELPGGGFLVGCTFAKQLSEAEVRLVAPAAARGDRPSGEGRGAGDAAATMGVRQERRVSPRRGGPPLPVLVGGFGPRPCWVDGAVRDRSRGGLRLLLPRAFAAGTVLRVQVSCREGNGLSALVRVRYCKAKRGGWAVGCEFLGSTAADVRLLFG